MYNVALPKRAPGALFSFGELEASDLVRIRPRIKPSFPTGTPMLNRLLTGVFGSRNERLLKQLQRIVTRIHALEPQMQAPSDAELQAKTPEFRERIAKGESLHKVLPEAFAVCREASVRVFGMRHFDVQLVGGMVLHMGKIAELRTGEGKTLTATMEIGRASGRERGRQYV